MTGKGADEANEVECKLDSAVAVESEVRSVELAQLLCPLEMLEMRKREFRLVVVLEETETICVRL